MDIFGTGSFSTLELGCVNVYLYYKAENREKLSAQHCILFQSGSPMSQLTFFCLFTNAIEKAAIRNGKPYRGVYIMPSLPSLSRPSLLTLTSTQHSRITIDL